MQRAVSIMQEIGMGFPSLNFDYKFAISYASDFAILL